MRIRNVRSKLMTVLPNGGRTAGVTPRAGVRSKTYAPFYILCVLAIAASLLSACGGGSDTSKNADAPKTGDATKPSKSAPSKPANTSAWGSFKVGSYVTYKTTVSAQVMGHSTDTTTQVKQTLADLTADKAVIDIETTAMGTTSKTRTEVPLTGSAPAGGAGSASVPNASASTGSETITVAGKSLDCKTYEAETDTAGTKVKTKTWMSDQVPGFLVKSVATSTGTMSSTTTMEVVDFKGN